MSQKHRRRQKRDASPAGRPAVAPRPAASGPAAPVRPPSLDRTLGAPWVLPAILAAAAILRFANIVFLQGSPFIDELQLDQRYYDEWAQTIVRGSWAGGSGPFWVDPLYAYFLAALYAIFGRSLGLVRVVQAGLGVLTCWLAARLGRRISGSVAVGNLSALLIGLFIPAVYYDGSLEKTTLCLVLFTAALLLYFDASVASVALAGVALGLAALTRGNLILLAPLGAIPLATDAGQPSRARTVRALAFLAGAFGVVGLATIRNVAVSGELIPTTSNFGQNLYIGQVCATGDGSYDCKFVRPDPRYEESDFRKEAERRLGRPLSAAEISAYWRHEAVKAMGADPGAVVRRMGRNLRLFFHEYENSDNVSVDVQADSSPVLRLPLLWMGELFPFAVLGAIVGWRRGRAYRLLAIAAGVYCASMLPLMVFARYRATIVPCLAVLAAAGLVWIAEAVRERGWQRLALAATLLLALGLYSLYSPDWLAAAHRKNIAISYHDAGEHYLTVGRQDEAIRNFERAVAIEPSMVIAAQRRLGDLYLARRDYTRAEWYMQRVLALKPNSPLGRQALVQLYTTMLADPQYRDDPGIAEKLTRARESAGAPAAAAERPNAPAIR